MRRGFTLIELLVVIAIIAILAAILFPVFTSARQAAWQAKCGAHGKELGIAMMMYLDDNNGRFPSQASLDDCKKLQNITWSYRWPLFPASYTDVWDAYWGNRSMANGPLGSGEFRYLTLGRYVKNQDIWVCPAPNGLYSLKFVYGYRMSWTFLTREFVSDGGYPDTPFRDAYGIGRTVTEVQSLDMKSFGRYRPPSKKIWVFCYALGSDVSVETYSGSGKLVPPLYPHNEGTTYCYCDGHAKWAETGCAWAPVHYTTSNNDRPHTHV
jgi:prepilin-type N-terminal cleavage/methylation domain-containing protein/prepilin-type processing-associated H-X9-DG protein